MNRNILEAQKYTLRVLTVTEPEEQQRCLVRVKQIMKVVAPPIYLVFSKVRAMKCIAT